MESAARAAARTGMAAVLLRCMDAAVARLNVDGSVSCHTKTSDLEELPLEANGVVEVAQEIVDAMEVPREIGDAVE